MQGSDRLSIVKANELDITMIRTLYTVYQPVMNANAVSLYLSLYYSEQVDLQWSAITQATGLYIDTLEQARRLLEQFQLLKVYEKQKMLYLQLIQPLSLKAFLTHDVYGRYFVNVCGKDAFQALLGQCHSENEIPDDAREISAAFDIGALNAWSAELEDVFNTAPQTLSSSSPYFNVESYLRRTTDLVFPQAMRTPERIRRIDELGNLYRVNEKEMHAFVGKAINTETGSFDVDYLERLIRRSPIKIKGVPEDPYSLTPPEFLQWKQPNIPLVDADLKLIEQLLSDFKLEPSVVNVLIEYVLETNDSNLSASYVQKIAAAWSRKGIHSKDEALQHIEKLDQKAVQKRSKKSSIQPNINRESVSTLSETERTALKQRLLNRQKGEES